MVDKIIHILLITLSFHACTLAYSHANSAQDAQNVHTHALSKSSNTPLLDKDLDSKITQWKQNRKKAEKEAEAIFSTLLVIISDRDIDKQWHEQEICAWQTVFKTVCIIEDPVAKANPIFMLIGEKNAQEVIPSYYFSNQPPIENIMSQVQTICQTYIHQRGIASELVHIKKIAENLVEDELLILLPPSSLYWSRIPIVDQVALLIDPFITRAAWEAGFKTVFIIEDAHIKDSRLITLHKDQKLLRHHTFSKNSDKNNAQLDLYVDNNIFNYYSLKPLATRMGQVVKDIEQYPIYKIRASEKSISDNSLENGPSQ